jgi:HK97 gp10 family phage protein
MTTRGSFEVKGLDGYLEDMVKAGVDVDQVVADVLTEAAPIAEEELATALLRTKQSGEVWTGETEASITASSVQSEGNYHFIELSVGGADVPQAFHKEYGSTRQAAEPFIRPAFTKLRRSKLKAMMKQVMERFGLPT